MAIRSMISMSTCLTLAVMTAGTKGQERVALVSPEHLQSTAALRLSDCTAALKGERDKRFLELHFGHDSDWPNVFFAQGRAYAQLDWSDAGVLVVDVENLQDAPTTIHIRVDDSAEADGTVHCRQGGAVLQPGERTAMRFDIGRPTIPGMRGQPRNRGLDRSEGTWIEDNGRAIDLSHIVAFQLFRSRPQEDALLRIHGIWLESAAGGLEAAPFVDRYGQFTDETWPGKLTRDEQFGERLAEEERDLAGHTPGPERSRFGGWKAGPRLQATGRFRVLKRDGVWWFVDPDGYLFWSAGITGLRAESGGPVLERERYFTWLPPEGDPLRAFYRPDGNGWVDFFKMNLQRKYGPDFEAPFHDIGVRRLRSWGFNTIGNWSDPLAWELQQVPYTIPVHYRSPSIPMWTRRSFPDVFSDAFEAALDERLAALSKYRDDPWLLGVFIDNELPWAGWGGGQQVMLPLAFLSSDTETATRNALVEGLREAYGDVPSLNATWGTDLTSWEDVADGVELNQEQRTRAAGDLSAMATRIATRYFSTCRRLMDSRMPGCLYLGPRFSSFNRESVAVAKDFCDVVCFNVYAELPTEGGRADVVREMDLPVLIGEYHFGALDRGMFHTGLRKAKDQQERAEKFARYLRTAVQEPWCVGAHWFQFRDQPLTGRFDGENYNIGFVTITDTPYPEMRAAAREVTEAMYRLRAGIER